MHNNQKCGRNYPCAASASACFTVRISLHSSLQLHIIYNREFFLRFSSALHQPSQHATSACAARYVSLCSTLRRSSQRTGFSASVVSCFSGSSLLLSSQPFSFMFPTWRNLRTRVVYGRTKSSDVHPKAAYGHPKAANGEFGKLFSGFHLALWGSQGCWMRNRSKPAGLPQQSAFVRKNACCSWERMMALGCQK